MSHCVVELRVPLGSMRMLERWEQEHWRERTKTEIDFEGLPLQQQADWTWTWG
jgi:hypothetical protein